MRILPATLSLTAIIDSMSKETLDQIRNSGKSLLAAAWLALIAATALVVEHLKTGGDCDEEGSEDE